jgi:hypothetical protein
MISNIYKSIVRSTVDLIEVLKSTTGDDAIQYWSWESRADENKLPSSTLLGVDAFAFEENRGLWNVRYALALSSYRDANLLNEITLIDIIQKSTGEGKKVTLRNSEGNPESEMVVSAWQLAPMAQAAVPSAGWSPN